MKTTANSIFLGLLFNFYLILILSPDVNAQSYSETEQNKVLTEPRAPRVRRRGNLIVVTLQKFPGVEYQIDFLGPNRNITILSERPRIRTRRFRKGLWGVMYRVSLHGLTAKVSSPISPVSWFDFTHL